MPLTAVQHIRRMRGGAQSHIMRCSDRQFYVVKFRNNPQHTRVLANEMLATRLAKRIVLPVPETETVYVNKWLIDHTPDLRVHLAHDVRLCEAGLQFGSRYVVDPMKGQVFDYLPPEMLDHVQNCETFAGMLVMDKWTGNTDGRQVAFWRNQGARNYSVSFIDQGHCFNGGEWSFPDNPLRGVYAHNEVYACVRGWHSFEPWISQVETMEEDFIWNLASEIPPDWYDSKWSEMEGLVNMVIARRNNVRKLIDDFRQSRRAPFPNWPKSAKVTVA